GYTAEQILSGWLFYYDRWQRDYVQSHPGLEAVTEYPVTKKEKKLAEKLALIQWIGTGEIFRIYPYRAADGHTEWLSLTGRRPSAMSLEQWTFMQTTMPAIKELLLNGKNILANEELAKLKEGQKKYAAGIELPSEAKINAERIYNRAVRPGFAGIPAIAIGLAALIMSLFRPAVRWMRLFSLAAAIILTLYVASAMGLLWWISGHIPLSNGPETMMFMALAALVGACFCRNMTLRGGLLIVAAMALFVTAMGGRTPRIGAMMPVLSSPLLSVHVMIVMISYALFLLIAILSAVALLSRSADRMRQLSALNRLMLTPAVCLLGAGIFIGAVWANQSWGRYWGWDPKETCALIMWIVYALPAHWGSRYMAFFRKDRVLHTYLLLAILTVIFTYFGANYLLGGLHSYA
ncbi:MAG: cytochrome c biogenesis protein CcsA, partial [Muribaculaceae bacterium]|nr:cytochrome c biogenesis protein CcsA [Muribaculaceae bacterium]